VVDHADAALEKLSYSRFEGAEGKTRGGLKYAKCLEYACASHFYCSGLSVKTNIDNAAPILTGTGKGRFVYHVEPMLRRFGNIAIPLTVYELIQPLDYMLADDPALCFDLFTHALTVGGQKHGFQGEQLGVDDVLVRIVSRCLAIRQLRWTHFTASLSIQEHTATALLYA
jgi:hypothetical protein